MGVHWKIQIFFLGGRGGEDMKNQYVRWIFLKKAGGRAWAVCRFKRGVCKKEDDVFEVGRGAFLMTPWLIGIKYPKQIPLCCTNIVISLIIVIIIKWDY